jgi:hypothetical protein
MALRLRHLPLQCRPPGHRGSPGIRPAWCGERPHARRANHAPRGRCPAPQSPRRAGGGKSPPRLPGRVAWNAVSCCAKSGCAGAGARGAGGTLAAWESRWRLATVRYALLAGRRHPEGRRRYARAPLRMPFPWSPRRRRQSTIKRPPLRCTRRLRLASGEIWRPVRTGMPPRGQYAGRASAPTSPGPPAPGPPSWWPPHLSQAQPFRRQAPGWWAARRSTLRGWRSCDRHPRVNNKAAPSRRVEGGHLRAAPQGDDPAQQRLKTGWTSSVCRLTPACGEYRNTMRRDAVRRSRPSAASAGRERWRPSGAHTNG